MSEEVSTRDDYGIAPERVDHADVVTAQRLWEAMRPEFDPNDSWTYDEIGPLLRTFTAVLTRRRAELCPPVGEDRVDAVARLLAVQVDGANPSAEDWPGWVQLRMPLARRVHEKYAPELRRLTEALRTRGREYGRASAEIGAQRGMIARALKQRRAAEEAVERAHAEITAARSRIRMLLGVQDSPDLGALTLVELIGRLVDHLDQAGDGDVLDRMWGVVADAEELRAHDHGIVPEARVRWTIGNVAGQRSSVLTGRVESVTHGLAVVVPDGTATATRWGLPTRVLTVVVDQVAEGGEHR